MEKQLKILIFLVIFSLFYFWISKSQMAFALTLQLKSGWNMISPGNLEIDFEKFRQDNPLCQIQEKAWWWNGKKFEKPEKLEPMKGYWIRSSNDCTANLSGNPGQGSLQLHPKWNMISTITEKSFNEINVNCQLYHKRLFRWNSEKKKFEIIGLDQKLDPTEGYWVWVYGGCELKDEVTMIGPLTEVPFKIEEYELIAPRDASKPNQAVEKSYLSPGNGDLDWEIYAEGSMFCVGSHAYAQIWLNNQKLKETDWLGGRKSGTLEVKKGDILKLKVQGYDYWLGPHRCLGSGRAKLVFKYLESEGVASRVTALQPFPEDTTWIVAEFNEFPDSYLKDCEIDWGDGKSESVLLIKPGTHWIDHFYRYDSTKGISDYSIKYTCITLEEKKITSNFDLRVKNVKEKVKPTAKALRYLSGELILKFQADPHLKKKGLLVTSDIKELNELNKKYNVYSFEKAFPETLEPDFQQIYRFKLALPEDMDLEEVALFYRFIPEVVFVQPNYLHYLHPLFPPNDPLYKKQWALEKIDWEKSWKSDFIKKGVIVAVVDSGVIYDHPDLKENIWKNSKEIPGNNIDDDGNGFPDDIYGWDFVDTKDIFCFDEDCEKEDNDPSDGEGHGTHVAGTIAAKGNNKEGVVGICPNCKIMVLRTAYKSPFGGRIPTVSAARAIKYAADNGARVINMSFGSYTMDDLKKEAVEYAHKKKVILVGAAGNDETDSEEEPHFPSSFPEVISVAASSNSDELSSFSNYGKKVDIAAPGEDIITTDYDFLCAKNKKYCLCEEWAITGCVKRETPFNYEEDTGTSIATPHVSGLVGLMLSLVENLKLEEIKRLLVCSADSIISTKTLGYGNLRINVHKTLRNLLSNPSLTCSAWENGIRKEEKLSPPKITYCYYRQSSPEDWSILIEWKIVVGASYYLVKNGDRIIKQEYGDWAIIHLNNPSHLQAQIKGVTRTGKEGPWSKLITIDQCEK